MLKISTTWNHLITAQDSNAESIFWTKRILKGKWPTIRICGPTCALCILQSVLLFALKWRKLRKKSTAFESPLFSFALFSSVLIVPACKACDTFTLKVKLLLVCSNPGRSPLAAHRKRKYLQLFLFIGPSLKVVHGRECTYCRAW